VLPAPVAVVKVIQDALVWAVHAHVLPAVMLIVPEPAAAVRDALAGEML
jgi:hypothetical protein